MKEDLFSECFDRKVSPEEFKQVFCNRCRNPRCVLAGWSMDRFSERVLNQEQRLFQTEQADPQDPRFQHLQEIEFPSLLRQAIRLNMADRRGDWSLPEENVHLAPIAGEPASTQSSDLVEEAVRNLKPDAASTDAAAPPADSAGEDQAPAESAGTPEPPEPKQPAEHVSRPVHFNPVVGNTEESAHGLMVGGEEPPTTDPKKPIHDPWAPKKEKVLKPGATVKMGGDNE